MQSPDVSDPLAYATSASPFDLIDSDQHWHRFEPYLPSRLRWQGIADELRQLRHRSAHCRRPHAGDLARLEARMRDLEPGARKALLSYSTSRSVPTRSTDPLIKKWRTHPVAFRLIEHAERQYDTLMRIEYSRRPWAPRCKADQRQ